MIKAQLLGDFITEYFYEDQGIKEGETKWKLYVNRAFNRDAEVTGIVLKGSDSVTIEYALKLAFKATNNVAEHKALCKGLELIREMKPRKLSMYSDF